jgi:hypothetical protein
MASAALSLALCIDAQPDVEHHRFGDVCREFLYGSHPREWASAFQSNCRGLWGSATHALEPLISTFHALAPHRA